MSMFWRTKKTLKFSRHKRRKVQWTYQNFFLFNYIFFSLSVSSQLIVPRKMEVLLRNQTLRIQPMQIVPLRITKQVPET